MSDFDYANARLRAMKSRLLSRRTLESLAEAGSVRGLVMALANTAYQKAVRAALARYFAEAVGMECLAEALRGDLIATLGQARHFFVANEDTTGQLPALVFRRYDVHNVKTVLRGLAQHVPASEILASTIPVGQLRAADLVQLARVTNPRAAIDLLATWAIPLARPLLESRARGRVSGGGGPALELALERWHLETALQAAREADEQGRPLYEMLMREADTTNILTALRLVGSPDTAVILSKTFGWEGLAGLFAGPGHIPFGLLETAARRTSVKDAVNSLARTPYGPALAAGAEAYAASGRLSEFERALAWQILQHAIGVFARDPLGIGVLLGFVALKANEVANLRAIAQGMALGEKPARILRQLVLAS